MANAKLDWAKKPNGILRILAFLFSIVGMALTYSGGTSRTHDASMFIHVAAPISFFVLFYFLLSYIVGEDELAKRFITEITFDIIHALFSIVAGALMLHDYSGYKSNDRQVAGGVFWLFLGIILIIDAILLFKDR